MHARVTYLTRLNYENTVFKTNFHNGLQKHELEEIIKDQIQIKIRSDSDKRFLMNLIFMMILFRNQ